MVTTGANGSGAATRPSPDVTRPSAPSRRQPTLPPGALVATLASTALVFVAFLALALVVLDRTATREAERDAGEVGTVSARVAMAPTLTDEVLAGDTAALERVGAAARGLMTEARAYHVKVWDQNGRIVWADNPQLIGQVFELAPEDAETLRTGGVTAGVSTLDSPENALDTTDGSGRLVEVYLGVRTLSGVPMMVETYYPYAMVADRAAELRSRFVPFVVASMALLALAQLPLTLASARRINRYRRERERLLERVIEASDAERRRVAAEVHDGAVQDLIGVSYGLAGAAEVAPGELRPALRRLADDTRGIVRALRSLLDSIYPVQVPATGWIDGLDDVVTALRQRGVEVEVDVPSLTLSPADEHLLLRVTREALRNALTHAEPRRVAVRLRRSGAHLVLDVSDDGRGFDPTDVAVTRRVGHVGMRLVHDLAADVGAELVVTSRPGDGTAVHLDLLERV